MFLVRSEMNKSITEGYAVPFLRRNS